MKFALDFRHMWKTSSLLPSTGGNLPLNSDKSRRVRRPAKARSSSSSPSCPETETETDTHTQQHRRRRRRRRHVMTRLLSGFVGLNFVNLGVEAARAEEEEKEKENNNRSISPWTLESLSRDSSGEWSLAPGATGVLYKIVEKGEGDREAGIFDPPNAFKTFPFVAVTFECYDESGRRFDSNEQRGKAEWNYQVGIRQALEDEPGGVNEMIPGERRQFVLTEDTVMENIGGGKLFGKKITPSNVLVDVTLLKLRPY